MYEIVPGLYLSNYQDVINKVKPNTKIFVMNCSKDLPMMRSAYGGTRLWVDDHPTSEATMTANLPLMVRYIEDQLAQGHDVVVHCFAGQQRSATVVAAYLMKTKGFTPDQAIEFIKSKKPDAFLGGVHFINSLLEYYHSRSVMV